MPLDHQAPILFVSYAHEDSALRSELGKHLRQLEREGLVQSWHDGKIDPGDDWRTEITEHFANADIIILLISSDFLASDFSHDIELSQALQRHREGSARVIPIILRPCDWQSADFAALQVLPTDGKPVVDWRSLDHGLADVAQGLRRILGSGGKPVKDENGVDCSQETTKQLLMRLEEYGLSQGELEEHGRLLALTGAHFKGAILRAEAGDTSAIDQATVLAEHFRSRALALPLTQDEILEILNDLEVGMKELAKLASDSAHDREVDFEKEAQELHRVIKSISNQRPAEETDPDKYLYFGNYSNPRLTSSRHAEEGSQTYSPEESNYCSCFISYSHSDRAFARRLYGELHDRGVQCWLDEHSIRPGERILDAIDRAITEHDKILLCCSEDSLKSWWVKDEIRKAQERERRDAREIIIPLMVDRYFLDGWEDGLAADLRSRLAANFTGWEIDDAKFEKQFERILEAIRADALQSILHPKRVLQQRDGREPIQSYKYFSEPICGHDSAVNVVRTLPGNRAISAGADGTLRTWDLSNGSILGEPLHHHDTEVIELAIIADGKKAVSVSADGTLIRWDLTRCQMEGQPVRLPMNGHQRLHAVAVTEDYCVYASFEVTSEAWLWDLRRECLVASPTRIQVDVGRFSKWILGRDYTFHTMAPIADGRRIVVGSKNRLWIWDLVDQRLVRENRGENDGDFSRQEIVKIVPFANGLKAAVGTRIATMQIWDLDTMRRVGQPLFAGAYELTAATTFDRDFRAVTGDSDGYLQVWDLQTGRPSSERLRFGHRKYGKITSIAVLDQGRHAVSACDDGTLRIWDLERGRPVGELDEVDGVLQHSASVLTVSVFGQGRRSVAAVNDGTLQLWDLETQKPIGPPIKGQGNWASKIVMLDDERTALLLNCLHSFRSSSNLVKIVDLQTGEPSGEPLGFGTPPNDATLFDGRRKAILASVDGRLYIYDLAQRKLIKRSRLVDHRGMDYDCPACAVRIIPGGWRAVTISAVSLRLWDLHNLKPVGTLIKVHEGGYGDSTRPMVIFESGRYVITGRDSYKPLDIWDLEKMCHCGCLAAGGRDLALFANDRRLLAARGDVIEVWDVHQKALIGPRLVGHRDTVTSIALIDGGRRAISASEDRTLRLWDLTRYFP